MTKRNIITLFIYALLTSYAGNKLIAQQNNEYVPVTFIRLTSQNDLYQLYLKSDKHFTNGAHIQFSHRKLDNPVFRKILVGNFMGGNENFIVSVGQDMHTPEDFELTGVDSSDRPYAGLLYATINRTISSPEKLRIFRSNLSLGLIGPDSGAGKTQNFLHKLIGNDFFQGWDNQIGNGLMLDYALSYRRGIKRLPGFMDISGNINVNLGTLMNFSAISSRVILGKFNNPYYNLGLYSNKDNLNSYAKNRSDFQLYITLESFGVGVLYNGTLSGSLVPFEESPYTIPPSEVPRWIYGGNYGIVFSYKQILFNYQHLILKQEYGSKGWQGWGELNLIFSF